MINQIDTKLTAEGRACVTVIMSQLGSAKKVQEILDADGQPGMESIEFLQKPDGKGDQGYRYG